MVTCDALRTERTRGRRFRTRSLYHNSLTEGKAGKAAAHSDEASIREGFLVEVQPQVRTDDSIYWTKKSCKEKKNKGHGKASSCAPSTQPSMSASPTVSFAPSANPTESTSPSTTPSVKPSSFPSFFPSVALSTSPSEDPSNYPSFRPSTEPSSYPTSSSAPTTSMTPTITKFKTILRDSSSESTCISPQPSERDRGNFNENQRLVFRYLLFVPDDAPDDDAIITDMKERIHERLIRHFLNCEVVGQENGDKANDSFYVWSISSNPPDILNSDSCDIGLLESSILIPDPKCLVVQAELTMKVYFPPNRRRRHLNDNKQRALKPSSVTSADQQVITEFGDYLNMTMSEGYFNDDEFVLMTRFLTFVMIEDQHETLDRGGLNIAGAEQQLQTKQEDSRVVAGAMTMAAAAICLVAVAIISLHRRKQRSDAYLKHIEDLSTFSDFDKDEADRGTHIMGDCDGSSLDWSNEHGHNGINYQERDVMKRAENTVSLDYQHDVHKCTSAYCETCHRNGNAYPTFIASNAYNIPDILEDLRHGPSIIEDSRSYSSPDTVDL